MLLLDQLLGLTWNQACCHHKSATAETDFVPGQAVQSAL
jgi:hypothetical protein